MNDSLSLLVEHADGTVKRWGPGEADPADIPGDLTFGDAIPGGFTTLQCSLLRRIDLDYPDQALYSTVKVLGAGNKVLWEGRLAGAPRNHGDSFGVQPGAVGWSAHLKDDPSFSMIYVDRELARWGDASASRRTVLGTAYAINSGSNSLASDSDTPMLTQLLTQITSSHRSLQEHWYDAGPGNLIGSLYYELTGTGNLTGPWVTKAFLSIDDQATTTDGSADLEGSGSGTLTAGGTRRYAHVQMFYDSLLAAVGNWEARWKRLAVFGDNSLTKRGTAPDEGFYLSDVVEHIVTNAAPLLTYTTGDGGSITPNTFVVWHLAFRDPVTAEDALLAANQYAMFEWGVWENREFFWRPTDPDRLCWEARLDQGAHLDLEGISADEIYNGVFVTYNDPAGVKHTVGPPGSRAEATDTTLEDTSDSNPLNQHGITRWGKLDIGQTTNEAGAIQLGSVWLAEHSLPARRGTITLTGTCEHPTAGQRPVAEIRSGDYIRISDHPADEPRRIISKTYRHQQRAVTLEVGNSITKLDALMERFGASLIGRM